jgi:murein DD-endopeptidase MepM/ murein hydrolase activator NlpD
MAIKDKLDQNFTDAVLKKTLIGNSKNRGLSANDNNDMIPQNDIVAISNSFTSLQNAFNKIYAYSLNVRNLHQFQEKRLQTINRETNLEAKTGGGSSIQSSGTPQNNLGSTTVLFDDLSKSIEGLNDKLKKTNLGGSGFSGTAGGMAGGLAGEELGALAGGAVGGPVGAGLGGFFGGVLGFFTGSKLGNNVQRRAAGGSIKSGSTYLIGERGPEVITFNGVSGRVTPNGQRGKPSMAEKYLLAAAERSSQSRTKFEKGNPIGPTSYSSKFSNYLSTLFGIIPTWVKNIFNPNMGTPPGVLGTGQYAAVGDLSKAKGDWKNDTDFINAINRVSQKYDIDANDLLGLIYHESAGTMSPTVKGKNSARGLFQFTRGGGFNPDEIVKLSRAQQVELADQKIFAANKLPRGANAGQIYAAVFLPGIAQNGGWSGVLSRSGEPYYKANPSLDYNKDDIIDYSDLAQVINRHRVTMGLGASPSITGGTLTPTSNYMNLPVFSPLPGGKWSGPGLGQPREGGKRSHEGLDIFAPLGTPVRAMSEGTIVYSERRSGDGGGSGFGIAVQIKHNNGLVTNYAHLSNLAGFKPGDMVKAGQIVGFVGDTGNAKGTDPHLHFEVLKDGTPLEPAMFLGQATQIPSATATAAAAKTKEIMLKEKGFRRVGNTTYSPSNWQIPVSAKSTAEVPAYRGGKGAKSEIDLYFKIMNQ